MWPIAAAAGYVAHLLSGGFAPLLDPSFGDLETVFHNAGYRFAQFLVYWAAALACSGIVFQPRGGAWRLASVLSSVGACLLTAKPETFMDGLYATPFVLAAGPAYWAVKRGGETARWFYFVVPGCLAAMCVVAFAGLWMAQSPLRGAAGSQPYAAFAVITAASALFSIPVWRRGPGGLAGVLAVIVSLTVAASPGRTLLESNRKILQTTPVLGVGDELPPVILIVVDTLRADMLSYRSDDAPPTPNIDAVARESVVFENAISPAPWTFPAMTSILTGVGPLERSEGLGYATPGLPTIAGILTTAGYTTQGLAGNHLIYRPFTAADGLQRIDVFASLVSERVLKRRSPRTRLTHRLTDLAIEWVRNQPQGPPFLYVHYFDPHAPYEPPGEYAPEKEGVAGIELYRGEVRYIDDEIGRLVEALKDEGVYDRAITVFVSDHGEEFYEHGGELHGQNLHQELLHVPLFIRMPGGAVKRRVSDFVSTRSIVPTLVDLLGLDVEAPLGWSQSLAPYIETAESEEPPVAPEAIVSGGTLDFEEEWSVIFDGLKYIEYRETGREEIYDLAADPGETTSIAADRPEALIQGRDFLKAYHAEAAKIIEAAGGPAGSAEDFEDRLRSLGYIQ